MKRLMILSIMLLACLTHAQESVQPSTESAASQSSHDVNSKNSDDISIGIANVHHIDLDNTEVDGGGNWLNKRIWYERSQAIFDEIRVMVSAVADLRIQFSNEVNAIGQKIDSFFEVVDFTKGQLDDKFKEILVALETEQKIVGDLSEEERNLQATIKQEIAAIDQIGKDIKSIGDVDNKIDQTLMQAFKTIEECRSYETKAWDNFKAIAQELDDKKARNIYYQMNNYKQNIDQKSNYLKSALLPYLHNVLVAKVENNIAKINDAIAALKNKGVDLEKLMRKSQEDDVSQLHVREKSAVEIAVKNALEAEQAKAEQIAKKAQQDLEKEKNKNIVNIMYNYYHITMDKVISFLHQGYTILPCDFMSKCVTSYSYPVGTYIYHKLLAARLCMHTFVEQIIMYFATQSVVPVTAKINKQSHDAQSQVQTTQPTSAIVVPEMHKAIPAVAVIAPETNLIDLPVEKANHQATTPSVEKTSEQLSTAPILNDEPVEHEAITSVHNDESSPKVQKAVVEALTSSADTVQDVHVPEQKQSDK